MAADRPGLARLIAIDWGTSSFRAYLTDAHGAILADQQSGNGILSAAAGAFRATLADAISPWVEAHGAQPILMAGMIGSRQGWREAPYVDCPASLAGIGRNLIRLPDAGAAPAWIVPGVAKRGGGELPDVMRGEETQVFGALARLGLTSGKFVLPGTHCKWVTVQDCAITDFATYMTGEVYAVLKEHSILGRLMEPGAPTGGGFQRGVEIAARARGGPGELLHHVFSARTLGLVGNLAARDIGDYLSGLLIGAEIREAARRGEEVVIIAGDALAIRYEAACRQLGIVTRIAPADATASGLAAIACASDLIGASP